VRAAPIAEVIARAAGAEIDRAGGVKVNPRPDAPGLPRGKAAVTGLGLGSDDRRVPAAVGLARRLLAQANPRALAVAWWLMLPGNARVCERPISAFDALGPDEDHSSRRARETGASPR